ncbi:MAG TPA: cysteine--tRNA ligase [Pirellulales bacterium]|jgi:cysteinyl-tRNA synthetase|nr:cysteine--tRNA ligase [Pirellulales bacterium]
MSIRVYSTLTRSKEVFEPVVAGRVGIYLCGPTVYKPSHIGHMVGPVIFDAIKRYLVYCGYQVTLVVNITDVDDKLIAEAQVRGISMSAVAEEMTADYHRNLAAMGIDTIDHFPRATENIDEIIRFTKELIDRRYAYESNGDVYFEVGRDAEYGKLSRRDVTALQGEGGETAERKRSVADFALWKNAKPGEPAWDSPWGKGRPGWHIECSAMSRRLLGETFDIHGGGLDLIFPHHENEIAQSECCHGKPQAKYWLHNGLMQASNEVGKVGGRTTREVAPGDQAAQEAGKIAKSKGANPFRDLLKKYSGETIRFFLLSTHYRRPIDYSEERIEEVEKGLDTFYRYFKRYERISGESFYALQPPPRRGDGELTPGSEPMERQVHDHRRAFLEAMDDDFNTGGGIGILFELVRALNKFADDAGWETGAKPDAAKLATLKLATRVLRELTATLGLFRQPIESAAAAGGDDLVGKLMSLLIDIRAEARKAKNFAMADHIRHGLGALGIALEDRPTGTEWTRQK